MSTPRPQFGDQVTVDIVDSARTRLRILGEVQWTDAKLGLMFKPLRWYVYFPEAPLMGRRIPGSEMYLPWDEFEEAAQYAAVNPLPEDIG